MPKSASTFITQICREICYYIGHSQHELYLHYLPKECQTGFFVNNQLSISELTAGIPTNTALVLKTHDNRQNFYEQYESKDILRTIVTYRNPYDAALSVYESGLKAQKDNDRSQYFYSIESIKQAIDYIYKNKCIVNQWLDSTYPLKISYNEIVRSPYGVAAMILEFLGYNGYNISKMKAVLDLVSGERKVYNFNVGVIGRHRQVFTDSDMDYAKMVFRNYYCKDYEDTLREN